MKKFYLLPILTILLFSCTNNKIYTNENVMTLSNTGMQSVTQNGDNSIDEKLSEKVVYHSSEIDMYKFALLAAFPERDIWLYNAGNNENGVMLFRGNTKRFYNWHWGAYGRYNSLQTFLSEFDNDGFDELAVITIEGYGTGCLLNNLYIVEIFDTIETDHNFNKENQSFFTSSLFEYGNDSNFYYDSNKCNDDFKIDIVSVFEKDDRHFVDINVNNFTTTHDIEYIFEDELAGNEFYGLIKGEYEEIIIKDGKIVLNTGLYVDCKYFSNKYLKKHLYADVIYRDQQFYIENYRFEE